MQTVDNTVRTFDVNGADIEAEIAAAEQREKQYNQEQRAPYQVDQTNDETDPNKEQTGEPKVRPDHVPEEFWNAETGEVDWAKLNERLKNGDQQKQEDQKTEELGDEINGHKLTTKHAEDFAPFYQQFEKDGSVSDDAVKYVEENFGIKVSKDIISAYMSGQIAKATGQSNEIANTIRTEGFAVVGGEQNYAKLTEWAGSTLSEAEIAEYDAAVEGKDPKIAKLAIQALWNRYRAEADIQPQVQIGKGATAPKGGDGYPNLDAYVKDTMRPEYNNDPASRAKVDAKLARSGNLTIPNY